MLPERDFVLLQHYAAKRMLPAVRVELMLAQVARSVWQSQGALKEAQLSDFLLRHDEEGEAAAGPPMTAEVGASIVAGMTGAKVIYLKKKEAEDGVSR